MGHGLSKFEFGLLAHSLSPFMLLVSFLKLIETMYQELFSQFSIFPCLFKFRRCDCTNDLKR